MECVELSALSGKVVAMQVHGGGWLGVERSGARIKIVKLESPHSDAGVWCLEIHTLTRGPNRGVLGWYIKSKSPYIHELGYVTAKMKGSLAPNHRCAVHPLGLASYIALVTGSLIHVFVTYRGYGVFPWNVASIVIFTCGEGSHV